MDKRNQHIKIDSWKLGDTYNIISIPGVINNFFNSFGSKLISAKSLPILIYLRPL